MTVDVLWTKTTRCERQVKTGNIITFDDDTVINYRDSS